MPIPRPCPKPAALLALTLLAGCGSEVRRDTMIPIAEAPPELLKIAQAKRPGMKFNEVWKVKYQGKDAYEFRGKDKTGQTHEVELSPTGEVFEAD